MNSAFTFDCCTGLIQAPDVSSNFQQRMCGKKFNDFLLLNSKEAKKNSKGFVFPVSQRIVENCDSINDDQLKENR